MPNKKDAPIKYSKTEQDEMIEKCALLTPPKERTDLVDCLDAIEASMGKVAYCGYLKGRAIERLWHYEINGWIASLKEARGYLDKLIEYLEQNES